MDEPFIQRGPYDGNADSSNGRPLNGEYLSNNRLVNGNYAPRTNRQAAKDLAAENGVDTARKSTDEILTDVAIKKGAQNAEDVKRSIDEFEKEQTKRRKAPPSNLNPDKPDREVRKKFPVVPPAPMPDKPSRVTKFATEFYCWKDGVVGTIVLTTDFAFKPLD